MRLILAIAAIVICTTLAGVYFLRSSAPMLESSASLPSLSAGGRA